MPPEVLSRRALNRALLQRQQLLSRAAPPGGGRAGPVLAMVEQLAGLQAQAPFPPYFGLWSRLDGFVPGDLAALLLDRRVVRIALMRGTIHLVSARDCLAGFAVGMWRISQAAGTTTLAAALFGPPADADRDAIRREGERMLAFAAPTDGPRAIRFADLT